MFGITQWIQFVAVFIAALILGKWFQNEREKLAAQGKSWYAAWATIPGILIIIIICLLIAIRQGYVGSM